MYAEASGRAQADQVQGVHLSLSLPEKRVLLPGQEQVGCGAGIANGKASIMIQIEGQQLRVIPLGYDKAVEFANGLLITALQERQLETAKVANGSILKIDGAGQVAG